MTSRSDESRFRNRRQSTDAGPWTSVSRRGVLIGVIVGLPVSVALLALSLRHLDADALEASLRDADAAPLALAVCVMAVVYGTQALRWQIVSGARNSRADFLRWVVGAVAVNNVVPGRAGDVLRIEWLARGAGIPRARAAASVAVDRGFDVVALLAALACTYPTVHHPTWINRVGLSAVALGGVVVVLFGAAYAYAGRSRSRRLEGSRVRRAVTDAARAAAEMVHGRRAAAAALLSLVAWLSWALSASLVARSLGLELSPAELLFTTAVINLGVAVPSSPGFIGTYQWLAVSTLGVMGVSHVDAFAFSVLMHAVWFVPTTLAGIALAARKLRPVVVAGLPRQPSENHAA
jgi:uncharacterized protein (TIRG00374 family)